MIDAIVITIRDISYIKAVTVLENQLNERLKTHSHP
jgi:hypothetical protein